MELLLSDINNGLILQFGINAKDTLKVTFPICFTSDKYSFNTTTYAVNKPSTVLGSCAAMADISGIYVYLPSAYTVRWICIGS